MLTVSNVLSFLRGPLAFLLLFDRTDVRIGAITLAMLSDAFDGFLARNYDRPTKFGAILDPVMDKFFVIFALILFGYEGRLSRADALFMLSRDFALLAFGLYLLLFNKWKNYTFCSIKSGKVATTIQLTILFFIAMGYPFPRYAHTIFVIIGLFVLAELFFVRYREGKQGAI